MHVGEVRGRADDLVACDDDVRGEGPDGRVSSASEEAEPNSSAIDRTFICDGAADSEGHLRGFWSEWIVLPSAGRNEKDALVQ